MSLQYRSHDYILPNLKRIPQRRSSLTEFIRHLLTLGRRSSHSNSEKSPGPRKVNKVSDILAVKELRGPGFGGEN